MESNKLLLPRLTSPGKLEDLVENSVKSSRHDSEEDWPVVVVVDVGVVKKNSGKSRTIV